MALTKATYAMVAGSPLNALDFGAVPDDASAAAANVVALQAAIDALTTNKTLYIPPGTYYLAGSLNFAKQNDGSSNKEFCSILADNVVLKATTDATPMIFGKVDETGPDLTNNFYIRGITFDADNLTDYAATLRRCYSFKFENCVFDNANLHGLYVFDKQHFGCTFIGCEFKNTAIGDGLHWEGDTAGNHTLFSGCKFTQTADSGCYFVPTSGYAGEVVFLDCTFENCGDGGLVIDNVKGLNIIGCYSEVCVGGRDTALEIGASVRGANISGNYFLVSDSSGQQYGISLLSASSITISGNSFVGVDSTGYAIYFDNASHGVVTVISNAVETLAGPVSLHASAVLSSRSFFNQSGYGTYGPVSPDYTIKSNNPRLVIQDTEGTYAYKYSWESNSGQFNLLNNSDVSIYSYEGANTAPTHYFKQPVRLPQYATGSRPSASDVGAGACIYDTTLSKPIWSNGTNWKDAAGTTV